MYVKRQCLIIALLLFSMAAFSQKKFVGTFSNGYKGAKLSFTLAANGTEIKDFTFNGYWRCGGSIESITAGPEKTFPVVNGKINAVIVEPENGGASAFRFHIDGLLSGSKASGRFRMSITGLSCDTYKLNWTAQNSK